MKYLSVKSEQTPAPRVESCSVRAIFSHGPILPARKISELARFDVTFCNICKSKTWT